MVNHQGSVLGHIFDDVVGMMLVFIVAILTIGVFAIPVIIIAFAVWSVANALFPKPLPFSMVWWISFNHGMAITAFLLGGVTVFLLYCLASGNSTLFANVLGALGTYLVFAWHTLTWGLI